MCNLPAEKRTPHALRSALRGRVDRRGPCRFAGIRRLIAPDEETTPEARRFPENGTRTAIECVSSFHKRFAPAAS